MNERTSKEHLLLEFQKIQENREKHWHFPQASSNFTVTHYRVQRISEFLLVRLPFSTHPTVRQRRIIHLSCPNFTW